MACTYVYLLVGNNTLTNVFMLLPFYNWLCYTTSTLYNNLVLYATWMWWAPRDSNPVSPDYESGAYTTYA